jgi:hypothetical protein
MSTLESERLICRQGVKNLLGRSRKLILDFPSTSLPLESVQVQQLRDTTEMERFIEVAQGLDKDFTQEYSELTREHYRRWANHPAHAFYVAEYKGQFLGLFFSLRVREESFERLMAFEIDERELQEENFPGSGEPGSSYMLNFFALNDEIASLLFLRYYAHLIAHQRWIQDVGVSVAIEDAVKLIREMSLHPAGEKRVGTTLRLRSYRNTLAGFLAAPKVLKLLFFSSESPEG